MSVAPTVFIVDDDIFMRDSLKFLLESDGLRVETYPGAEEFLESFNAKKPGCIVLDLRLNGMSGLDLHDRLLAMGIKTPCIMITGHGAVETSVRALKSGILDFLEKPFHDGTFLDCVRRAIDKDAKIRAEENEQHEILGRMKSLSEREKAVLRCVMAGMVNKAIAARLELSSKTVEYHRARLMRKLQVNSVVGLVRMALHMKPENNVIGPLGEIPQARLRPLSR